MELIITENYEEMSQLAAIELLQEIAKGKNKRTNIAITAGSTPIRMYEIIRNILIDKYYPYTHYYNFDEIPVKGRLGVTIDALNKLFFRPNNIDENKVHIYNETNFEDYDEKIRQDGGLDMVIMGLGADGHFCGNLSGTLTKFDERSRAVSSNITRRIRDRLIEIVGGEQYLTDFYVTFGPSTIMKSKKIILIVNGSHKAEILKRLITETISLELPASILKLHPDFTIIADKEASKYLLEKEQVGTSILNNKI